MQAASEYDERSRELEASLSSEKSAAMGHRRQLEALRRRKENREELRMNACPCPTVS